MDRRTRLKRPSPHRSNPWDYLRNAASFSRWRKPLKMRLSFIPVWLLYPLLNEKLFMPNPQPSGPILRFVHLSDIHFGQPGSEAANKDVQKQLIKDCADVQSAGIVSGPATAILVAGDVAYSGTEAEYHRAGDWIDDVADAAKCHPRSVRLIPGNHDVDWKKLDDAGQAQLERLRGAPSDKCGDLLHSAFSIKNSPLVTPLEDYLSFAAAYGCGFDDSQKPYHDITYPLGDRRITIRGLSSVLASNRADSQGAMILSSPQFTTLDGHSSELVVMVHHPLDWFKNKQEASGYFKSRSKLLLTGHEHLVEFVLKVWNGDFQQVHVAAGAVNPPSATSIHQFAYNWIELSRHETKSSQSLVVRIVPRAGTIPEPNSMPTTRGPASGGAIGSSSFHWPPRRR